MATFTDLIINTIGEPYTLIASSNGLASAPSSAIDVVAGPQVGLVIEIEPPAIVQAGAGFAVEVGAKDQFGNPTTLTGSVSVAILNSPVGPTLGGTTTVTASGGVALFSGLTLNKVGTGYTLQVTSPPLTSATTSGITVTPAAVTQLVVVANGVPPATALAGQNFASPAPVIVDAEDPFGNLVPSFNGPGRSGWRTMPPARSILAAP